MSYPTLLLILGALLVFQGTVMDYLAVCGIKPDLIMLFVVFNGFLLGPREGAFLGFAGGIIEDFFVGNYIGINALTMMTAGIISGVCGERLYKENSLVVAVVTFLAATISLLINYVLLRYLDVKIPFIAALWHVVLPTALYTSILVPLFYMRVLRSVIIKNKDV